MRPSIFQFEFSGREKLIGEQKGRIQFNYGPDEKAVKSFVYLRGKITSDPPEELYARPNRGDAEAQYKVANTFVDKVELWKWLCLAANNGHLSARYGIACRMRSRDVPVATGNNKISAYKWWSVAAEADLNAADGPLSQFAAEMTSDEAAEAKRRAREWQQNTQERIADG